MLKAYLGCVQLGNLDLDRKIYFVFAIECQIQKRILMLRYLFLDLLFTVGLGNLRKDLKNCP